MSREADFWKWLRARVPRGHFSRIESGDTSSGFPDVHYTLSLNGQSGTIELKSARLPRAEIPFTDRNGIRDSQRIWIREEVRAGGKVHVFLDIKPLILIIHGSKAHLINGSFREHLLQMSVKVLDRGMSPKEIRSILENLL